jgi:uncharacterized membrane protein (DUF2068 family)
MVKTQVYEPIQVATAVFEDFVAESKKLWKALKRAIPATAKEMADDAAVAKVYFCFNFIICFFNFLLKRWWKMFAKLTSSICQAI